MNVVSKGPPKTSISAKKAILGLSRIYTQLLWDNDREIGSLVFGVIGLYRRRLSWIVSYWGGLVFYSSGSNAASEFGLRRKMHLRIQLSIRSEITKLKIPRLKMWSSISPVEITNGQNGNPQIPNQVNEISDFALIIRSIWKKIKRTQNRQ